MVRFEWDPEKARRNRRKHGISFEDAMHVFEDPYALFEPDRGHSTEEERWLAVGLVGGVAVVLVAHAAQQQGPDEIIRLISARRATRKERNRYEQTRAQNVD